MKAVLVNHQDSNNINSFSGTSYFMSRALKGEFSEVLDYTQIENRLTFTSVITGHLKKTLRPIGKALTDYLKRVDFKPDVVFCQGGNSSIPFYSHATPIVFWHDSTWSSFLKGYASKKKFNEFKTNYKYLYLWDKMVIERADLLIYSSKYVAEACMEHYKVSDKKIKVVPFGANLSHPPNTSVLSSALTTRLQKGPLMLTFIGKDWKRKGLVSAFHLVKKLNSSGIDTRLNIIGCNPDLHYLDDAPYVNKIGFINKLDPQEYKTFEQVLKQTHFLLHPASAEPFGIVLCEANAWGIPILGTDIEGLKTIVRQPFNGFLFKKSSFISESLKVIEHMHRDFDRDYTSIFNSSLNEFGQRLNWQTNAKEVKQLLTAFTR